MPGSPRSSTSAESLLSDGQRSPIEAYDSSAALIVAPDADGEDRSHNPFDFGSDDDAEDGYSHSIERVLSSTVPPLSSLTVYLYLTVPYLKLGAFLLPTCGFTLQKGIPLVLFFAGLSALARQIWYMLARYVRCADLEEIMLETFVRDRRREGRRLFLRQLVRLGTVLTRVLLAVLYLRASVDALTPLVSITLGVPPRVIVTLILAALLSPICFAPNVSATRVAYATWISTAAYAVWFSTTVYAYAHGMLSASADSAPLGTLWQPVAIVAFTFGTSWTLPLYASLRGTIQAANDLPKRSQSFKLLSLLAIGTAIAATLPLIFFQAPTSPPNTPTLSLTTATALSEVSALALTIPSLLITAPALPISVSLRRVTNLPLSKSLLYIITIGLSLLPRYVANVFGDITLVLVFLGTYMLPALIHIVLHNMRRPLSIIIPPSTALTPSASSPTLEPHTAHSESHLDELLQQKERSLQRRRLGRRIIWDIGVWVLLVPVGGGGLAWAAGRFLRKW